MSSAIWSDWVAPDRRPIPELVPLFPVTQLVPSSPCPHRGKIKRGSKIVCIQCHQSGFDHRRFDMDGRIELDPETNLPPRPEYAQVDRPVYAPTNGPTRGRTLTRKQKRAAMTAARKQAEQG